MNSDSITLFLSLPNLFILLIGLKYQEEAGKLKFVCLSNDGIDEHMVWYLFLFLLIYCPCFNFCFSTFPVNNLDNVISFPSLTYVDSH